MTEQEKRKRLVVWNKILSTQSKLMSFTRKYKNVSVCLLGSYTIFFLISHLGKGDPSQEDLIFLCKAYWADRFHRDIARLLMCKGVQAPPPPTSLESPGVELNLLNIHPESIS